MPGFEVHYIQTSSWFPFIILQTTHLGLCSNPCSHRVKHRTLSATSWPIFLMVTMHYGLNVCVPPEFTCWSYSPQWDGIWRWSLWGQLGHEDVTLIHGVSALIRRDMRDALSLSLSLWGHSEKLGRQLPLDTKSAGTLILDFPASRCKWDVNVCCQSHPDSGNWL